MTTDLWRELFANGALKNVIALSSIPFLFRFLPVCLVLYWIVPGRVRPFVLFAASLLFYSLGTADEPWTLVLLIVLVLANALIGRAAFTRMGKEKKEAGERGKEKKDPLKPGEATWGWSGVQVMLGADVTRIMEEEGTPAPAAGTAPAPEKGSLRPKLDWAEESGKKEKEEKKEKKTGGGKQLALLMIALDTLTLLAVKALAFGGIAPLPIGISFFLFKMISFQADILRGKPEEKPRFFDVCAYFTLFFQITQGPIMRFETMMQRGRLTMRRLERGLFYIVCGLAMKVLLADRIFVLWNEIGKIGYESISTPLAWIGAYAYSFELYYDFWGYSLMAAGCGILFGLPFVENFRHPYAASGVGDFYRRWHTTLGSFYRDYIYIPLGGNRHGKLLQMRNLMIVWILTGVWHGTGINFLLWGVILGVFVCLEHLGLHGEDPVRRAVGRILVLVGIPLTWVVFAVPGLSDLGMYFARLFPFFGRGATLDPMDWTRLLAAFWPYLAAGAVLLFPQVFEWIKRRRTRIPVAAGLVLLFWWAVYMSNAMGGNTFMYFTF